MTDEETIIAIVVPIVAAALNLIALFLAIRALISTAKSAEQIAGDVKALRFHSDVAATRLGAIERAIAEDPSESAAPPSSGF